MGPASLNPSLLASRTSYPPISREGSWESASPQPLTERSFPPHWKAPSSSSGFPPAPLPASFPLPGLLATAHKAPASHGRRARVYSGDVSCGSLLWVTPPHSQAPSLTTLPGQRSLRELF